MTRSGLIVLWSFIFIAPAQAGDWPAWRGPRADGTSAESALPLVWGTDKNIRWKVALPEPGNSTPIIWGSRVFITQSLDKGQRRAILAFDRATGNKVWQRELACPIRETSHPQNPPCSASPVADGNAVYAHFASAGVVAYDFAGKKLWHRDLGPVLHKWGNGSSPVLYKDLLIVYQGPGEPTFLTALNKRTGETVWARKEPGINSPIFGSWSTPLVIRTGGRDELIMPFPGDRIGGQGEFKAYDPSAGKVLWRCQGLGTEVYAMPLASATGDLVIGISGHNGPTMAVRPGGNGDVSATHRLWRSAGKLPQRIGSGVLDRDRLFLADAEGFVECLDAKSGGPIWKARLPGKLWSSILLANGRLYISSLEGKTFVLAAAPEFRLLASNDLGEPIYASPAVCNGDIFLRTYGHLYCIGTDAQPKPGAAIPPSAR
jgi:outer membrane protein assembly factor BamB